MRTWIVASIVVVVVVVVALGVAGAVEAANVDIGGTWNCCGSGGAGAHVMHITDAGGKLGGTAVSPSGTTFAAISGTVSGSHATIVETYNSFDPGYVATFLGTVAGDGRSMSGTWSSNASQSGTWTAQVAAAAPPVLGKSVDAAPVSGTVLIELPGKHKLVRLTAGERIPLGSTVDATHGVVAVTAADHRGQTITGRFYDGAFRVTQKRTTAAELTDLTLTGQKITGCKPFGAVDARHHPHRSLWGSAKGNFQTVGHYASAAVRGTKWFTEDECAGTLIHVAEGFVTVDDFAHHRTFNLKAPHNFLAHPGMGG
jgi:hypothetical protein